ncbi:hypothetical protein C5167_019226 [Papaver somniferum]|uniref:Myb-like domain-containing protein n=1 Tax=Papaver somniferum TaxID=3469 RepID=A0A4Y7ITP1_PAPSO|nr:hypothetical protein C5167_019226 [Papaver somniferum]
MDLESVIKTGKSLSERKIDHERRNRWTSAENVALINALKAFPKDVTMRWENIADAFEEYGNTWAVEK